MTKRWLLLILACKLSCTVMCAQLMDNQLKFAAELYDNANYSMALKEYLRAYYFERDGTYSELSLNVGQCFAALDNYPKALDFFTKYERQNTTKSDQVLSVKLHKSQIHLLQEDPKSAIIELLGCSSDLIANDADRYYFHLGFAFLVDNDFDAGFDAFSKLSYASNLVGDDMDIISDALVQNYKTNHSIPKVLSYILPGAGQVYNGNYADGANSLGLVGGLGLVFAEVLNTLSFLDALVSVGPFIIRYYIGGAKNAAMGSERRELSQKQVLLKQVLLQIRSAQPSSK